MHTDLFGYVFSILFHTSSICSSFRIPPPPPAVLFFPRHFQDWEKIGTKICSMQHSIYRNV